MTELSKAIKWLVLALYITTTINAKLNVLLVYDVFYNIISFLVKGECVIFVMEEIWENQ